MYGYTSDIYILLLKVFAKYSKTSNKYKYVNFTNALDQTTSNVQIDAREDEVYGQVESGKRSNNVHTNCVTPQKINNNKLETEIINECSPNQEIAKSISEKYKNQIPGTADSSANYRKNKKLRRNHDRKVKDYNCYNPSIFTPKEPLLQSKKYRKDARNPNISGHKKHISKGQSHGAPKHSVLKNAGLEVMNGVEPKEERKTRYAAEKDSNPDKHSKHSAYTKGTNSLALNNESETSPGKKKKAKKAPQFRGAKMIQRDSNKSPRQFNF